jgi:hypothetical protein
VQSKRLLFRNADSGQGVFACASVGVCGFDGGVEGGWVGAKGKEVAGSFVWFFCVDGVGVRLGRVLGGGGGMGLGGRHKRKGCGLFGRG